MSRDQGRGGAYLLTWTTYGTWLPGDPRGFTSAVKREHGDFTIRNVAGTPRDADRPLVRRAAAALMNSQEVVLDIRSAEECLRGFQEACVTGDMLLRIAAIMRTHCHAIVISQCEEGEKVLQRMKGVSSRRMSQACGKPAAGTWWTRHGSRRLLDTPGSFERAVAYVREQQSPLVLFEDPLVRAPANTSRSEPPTSVVGRCATVHHWRI